VQLSVENPSTLMPTPFSAEDLGRVFDSRTITRGRSLILMGTVDVTLEGDRIVGATEAFGLRARTSFTASPMGRNVVFSHSCTCGTAACAHLAATALAALDRFPALRKAEQRSFLDALETPLAEKSGLLLTLEPGDATASCFVTTSLVGERSGKTKPTTPSAILADPNASESSKALAQLLGGGVESRVSVAVADAVAVLERLRQGGLARWNGNGRRLKPGEERVFDADKPPALPQGSAVLLTGSGPWYVDAVTGAVGRMRLRRAKPQPVAPNRRVAPPPPRRPVAPLSQDPAAGERLIEERTLTPVLRLRRITCPDENGRPTLTDSVTVEFDYGGLRSDPDDDKQFLRAEGPGGPVFIRRDAEAEALALSELRNDGFSQVRVADAARARGRRALVFRDRDAGERWQRFMAERVPALEARGWRVRVEGDFGPRLVEQVGTCDMRIADAEGGFSLAFGIEIDGVRHPLLPILMNLIERGGIEAARIVGDDLITSLEDGRVVRLPAERIRRLLAIMGDLIDSASRRADESLVLPDAEAATVIELEELLTARWQDTSAIEACVERFRGEQELPPVTIPASFKGSLRPYQNHGVAWLQHLRANGLAGFLADDMGLGKTAQTIAHITMEEAEGRLDRPALIIVPTSLVPNWVAELSKFAPHLRVIVLHGGDRHERRSQLGGFHVVITTYTVLARDIEAMRELRWHMVVLDEAQAIKSPDSQATRAVCQLESRHRVCLSGTPIENNLGELWTQFAFLMPGLLGDRRGFGKRFRTPIEKKGDDTRRVQLIRRIRPFILRRTKSEVATELPPKHTILRRITLGPEQRELYETIRASLHERVREQIVARSLAQSRIVVLDALLKLRQACCDPRLVKLAAARSVTASAKLDDLMEMLTEQLAEGRRILLFSQFTSMLDLISPRLKEAGIRFVELRGDTHDRAEPVRAFEAGEVPLFLISLKAGGRGLNLVSADTVIHYDPWWNPAVEDQASDRAHRIGQTKSVFVYKLIASDTVEERIVALQQRKAVLANIAFSDENDVSALDFDDIEYLFGEQDDRQAA
jgi:superfamily II DNA or RNA helicase